MRSPVGRSLVVLCALLALFFCTADVMAAAQGDQVPAAEVRKEINETMQVISSYTAEQRDAAVAKAKEALAKTDVRIEQLQQHIDQNWQQMSQDARIQAKSTLRTLQKQRTEIAEWYGGMKHSSADAWEEIKQGFSKSYHDLESSLAKAREKL
jgi:hypothetical protein